MRRSYSAAGTFSLSLSRLDIENPRATSTGGGAPILSLLVYGYWLLYKVQSSGWLKRTTLTKPTPSSNSGLPRT